MKVCNSRFCNCVYFSSAAFARKIEKLATESWKQVNLAPAHAYLLLFVIDKPGVQPGDIAKELMLQPSTITRFIEKLEEKMLLTRTVMGKTTNVYATDMALEMLPQLKACSKNFYDNYAAILGASASSNLVNTMNQLTDKL
jgi:MarR family transcriptional regulator, organic hydroperoxide resistance regulator